MGLFERITAVDETKISVHSFGASLREVARGNATVAQLVAVFDLDAADQTDLAAIQAKYLDQNSTFDRVKFMMQMEDAFILAEAGIYNKSQVTSALGF